MSEIIPVNRTFAPLQAFVDELRRCGLTHAVTCPGSRNAPLILTLAAQEGVEAISVIDERAAGFMALGLAKASGRPVAVTCTSGTAAANLHPAVVEAHEARVPLIVLTADRPPELRDVGAGQAIDQLHIYGRAAKWFVEVGNHEPGREAAVHHRALACRAWWTAAGGRPGPVHLNFPLRDPLAPTTEELDAEPWQGRPDGRPWVELREHSSAPHADDVQRLAERIAATPRGAIVCGPTAEDVAEPVTRLAAEAGWPVLAEPTSGLRCGEHDRSHVVAHYDVLLRIEKFDARPEIVLRVGDHLETLRELLARPISSSSIPMPPGTSPRARQSFSSTRPPPPPATRSPPPSRCGRARRDPAWLESWRTADAAVPRALAEAPDQFEPKALAALEPALPPGATVWIGSSMPIRDVTSPSPTSRSAFWPTGEPTGSTGWSRPPPAQLSRLTAAPGCSPASWRCSTTSAACWRPGARAGLTIVCLDNGGGSIFDFLPVAQAADAEIYERHIATPSGIDFEKVAALADMPYSQDASDPGLVVIRTDRADNVRLHRETVDRAAAALG